MKSDKRQRTQFQAKDLRGAPDLRRPLNDFALDVQTRVEAIETGGRLLVLPVAELAFGGTVAAGTAPLPIKAKIPKGFRVSGLLVVRAEDITSPGTAWTTPPYPTWRLEEDKVSVEYISGVSTNTTYRITFALVGV